MFNVLCNKFALDINKKASTKRSSAYKQLSRIFITALRLEFKLFNSNLVPLARGKEKILPVVQAGKESP